MENDKEINDLPEAVKDNLLPGKPKPNYRVPTGMTLLPEKIAAVEAFTKTGVSNNKISKALNLSHNTVKAIKQGDFKNKELVDQVKGSMAAYWWITSRRGLEHITDDKLEKSSAAQLAIVASIATEKALLVDGKPTMRVEVMDANESALNGEIEALQAEVERWKQGEVVNTEPVS